MEKLTPQQYAVANGITKTTVHRWLDNGLLPFEQIGVYRFINSNAKPPVIDRGRPKIIGLKINKLRKKRII